MPLGTLRRQLGTLIRRGYAVPDPKARLQELRPKWFDGMAALEAADQH
jgi:DNA-binding IclR family transcriptional regulator